MATLHTCNGSFNTFDDPSGRICIPNKTGEVNLNAFNMITRINLTLVLNNESKDTLKYMKYYGTKTEISLDQ